MPKISTKTELGVPANILWQTIGKFGAIGEWHPMIESTKATGSDSGATRTLNLIGGGAILERLEHINDKERVYRYSIVSSPLPMKDYVAEIRVTDQGDGTSTVEWSCDCQSANVAEGDASKAIREMYEAGMNNLRKMFPSR